ncbi:mitochondrial metal transporter 1 [Monosporozyma unispora]
MIRTSVLGIPTKLWISSVKSHSPRCNIIIYHRRQQRRLLSTKRTVLQDEKLSQGLKDLQKSSELEIKTKQLFEQDPNLQKLANDFTSHDHIHLKESETELNDSFTPDGRQHAKNMAFKASLNQVENTHSHGHSHSHSQPNPLLVLSLKEIKKNPSVRITWIGLAMNVGIALGKFVGGIVFHSQALLADSVHAASDLISDILTLFSVSWAGQKPNKDFPYGYGKIETVGSLAVSTILAMAGVSIGWSSLCAIVGPIIPHTIVETITAFMGHASEHAGHTHGVTPGVTNINAAWIAGGSIVMKEWIFQATKKIATDTKSNVLMANAWHHRVDSLTSLVALVAITSSYFFGIQSLDAIGGLFVSGLVIKAGGEGMVESMKELIDKSVPATDERYIQIQTVINESLSKLVSNNNADKPYKIKELTVLLSGRNIRINTVLEAPIQKWDNVLDIKELENVTTYLKTMLTQNISNLGKLDIEFVQEGDMLEEESESEKEHDKHSHEGRQDHAHTHESSRTFGHTHRH